MSDQWKVAAKIRFEVSKPEADKFDTPDTILGGIVEARIVEGGWQVRFVDDHRWLGQHEFRDAAFLNLLEKRLGIGADSSGDGKERRDER